MGLNCNECSFREWDGFDNVCTAYLDKHEGKPVVQTVDGWLPLWCPLNQPRRIDKEDLEKALHPTVRVALQNMHLNNGEAVPDSLLGTVEPERSTPRGDR